MPREPFDGDAPFRFGNDPSMSPGRTDDPVVARKIRRVKLAVYASARVLQLPLFSVLRTGAAAGVRVSFMFALAMKATV